MDIIFNDLSPNKLTKIAFFCSRNLSPESILKCYDWATGDQIKKNCIISGFHSEIEKDVLHFLLKRKIQIVWVLARKEYKKAPKGFEEAIKSGLLRIISTSNAPRQSTETARIRNEYILSIADEVVFASLTQESSLYPLYEKAKSDNKPITLI